MRISFTGDIGFTKHFTGLFDKSDLLDERIVDFLNDCDTTVANVEGVIYEGQGTAAKPLLHVNRPGIKEFLKKINAKIWNISNNHIIDCGPEGVKYTLDFARDNGYTTVGIGMNEEQAGTPVILKDEKGVSVGLFAVTQELTPKATENSCGCIRYDDYKKIKQIIKNIKKQCKWCVIMAHAGEEFNAVPLPYIRKRYRKYLKLGADVVIAHHPHVVENYEKVGKKTIFYSLGNFIFDTDYQRKQDYTDAGVLVKIDFGKDTYSFETIGTKIDRENHRIEKGEIPAIFTNISGKLYKELWPLSAKVLQLNFRVKNTILFPNTKDFNSEEWDKWEQSKTRADYIDMLIGVKLYSKNKWQKAPKELIEYIKGKRL